MSRPVVAEFPVADVMGRTYTVRVLGAESEATEGPSPCGVVLPSAVVAIRLPHDVVDPFADKLGPDGRTVWFDVSDTPILALAGVMALTPPAPPVVDTEGGHGQPR